MRCSNARRMTMLLACAPVLVLAATAQSATTYGVDKGGLIPDGAPVTTQGISFFRFTVTGSPTITDEVALRVALTHQSLADLTLSLRAPWQDPAAQGLLLVIPPQLTDDPGDFRDVLFSDLGLRPLSAGDPPPYQGVFQPIGGSLTKMFAGGNPNGEWTLIINDSRGGDTGELFAPGTVPEPWPEFIGTQITIEAHDPPPPPGVIPEPATAGLALVSAGALVMHLLRRRPV